jgi:hypothetical protein
MALSLVIVLLAVGSVASTSEIGQNKSHKSEYGFEKNDLPMKLQCENVMKNSYRKIDYLKYTSIVFGLLESVQNELVGATCYKDSKRIIDGVKDRETWAVKGL